jgi:hypothetical protein
VQDLINSFVRLSAAMTVYSVQQMQSAVDTLDPKDSAVRLKQMLDFMSDALTAQIDDSKKSTVESMSKIGADVVGRTFDALNVLALKAGEKTASPADIPKAAEEVFAAH